MSSLKQQIISGVFYTAVAKYSGIIISLVVMAVLARLLTPGDFGVVAIATVFINFFNIFTNIGISSAIVQFKELTKRQINEIYMFTIWMGLLLSLLFAISSPFISAYYQDERLLSISLWLSISLFFSSAGIVPNSLFFKDKEFKFIAWRSFTIQVLTGLLSIIAAWIGAGLYTLLIQPILSNLLIFVISLKRYPQCLIWTTGLFSLKQIWGYSMDQFLFNVMAYFIRNLDKMLIGRYISMVALGYYEKSYRLMSLPIQNLTYVVTPVLHPLLSDYQNDNKRLGEINERMFRFLAFIGFPLSIGLCFCAKELVLLFFGSQWEASIPAFKILALSCGFQIIMSSSGSFFQSNNDTRGQFICGLFTALVTCSGYLISIIFYPTLEGFAWSILLSYLLSFLQCYWQLYRFSLQRSLTVLCKQIVSPLVVTAIMAIALWTLTEFFVFNSIWGNLLLKGIVGISIWLVYIKITHESFFQLLKRQ